MTVRGPSDSHLASEHMFMHQHMTGTDRAACDRSTPRRHHDPSRMAKARMLVSRDVESTDAAAFGRIDAYVESYCRSMVDRIHDAGPFRLYPDYARPKPGATHFTSDDVGMLVALANENPPWASIDPHALIVEWNELEWIVEQSPGLTDAVSAAGLGVYDHPLLIEWALAEAQAPAPPDVETEMVDPESDARELLAAWRFTDSVGRPAKATEEETLERVRTYSASLSQREVDEWSSAHSDGVGALRYRGAIVAVGRHEPFDVTSAITSLGVLPAFRRRGFGAALAEALARDAFANGVELVFVESSKEAAAMYEQAGFRLAGTIGRMPL